MAGRSTRAGEKAADEEWLVGQLLVIEGSTGPVISIRPVSRMLKKRGRLGGRWLVSGGSTRPVIRLRLMRRLLMKSGWWVGHLVN